MKYYLIRYDRSARRLLGADEFELRDADAATRARLDAEIEAFRSGSDIEVVLLEAPSLETLRHTHASYFSTPEELLDRAVAG